MVDGPNTYGFCGGDPVNRSDPMGTDYTEVGADGTVYWVPEAPLQREAIGGLSFFGPLAKLITGQMTRFRVGRLSKINWDRVAANAGLGSGAILTIPEMAQVTLDPAYGGSPVNLDELAAAANGIRSSGDSKQIAVAIFGAVVGKNRSDNPGLDRVVGAANYVLSTANMLGQLGNPTSVVVNVARGQEPITPAPQIPLGNSNSFQQQVEGPAGVDLMLMGLGFGWEGMFAAKAQSQLRPILGQCKGGVQGLPNAGGVIRTEADLPRVINDGLAKVRMQVPEGVRYAVSDTIANDAPGQWCRVLPPRRGQRFYTFEEIDHSRTSILLNERIMTSDEEIVLTMGHELMERELMRKAFRDAGGELTYEGVLAALNGPKEMPQLGAHSRAKSFEVFLLEALRRRKKP